MTAALATVVLVLTVLAGTWVLPIAARIEPAAQAAQEVAGSTSLTLAAVRGGIGAGYSNTSATGTDSVEDCIRYYNNSTYSSSPVTVTASSTPLAESSWSYGGRGPPLNAQTIAQPCSTATEANQSAIGFMPNNAGTVNAGSVFLVGRIRHNNIAINTPANQFHSSINVTVNGSSGSFPFAMQDTTNTSNPTVIARERGNYSYVGTASSSNADALLHSYGYSSRYNVNYWYGYTCPGNLEIATIGNGPPYGCY